MLKCGVGSLVVKGQGIVTERDSAKVILRVTIPASPEKFIIVGFA
jgi:hypothetical protein